jgi:hypothetical protein
MLAPPWIGKTNLAIGPGVKAAQAGHSVLFDTASSRSPASVPPTTLEPMRWAVAQRSELRRSAAGRARTDNLIDSEWHRRRSSTMFIHY